MPDVSLRRMLQADVNVRGYMGSSQNEKALASARASVP
jgi:hypothetical protein